MCLEGSELGQGLRLGLEAARGVSSRHVNPLATDSPNSGGSQAGVRIRAAERQHGSQRMGLSPREATGMCFRRGDRGEASPPDPPKPDTPIIQKDGLHLNGQLSLCQPLKLTEPGHTD